MPRRTRKPRTLWQSINDQSRPVDMSMSINRVLAAACDAIGDGIVRALRRKPRRTR